MTRGESMRVAREKAGLTLRELENISGVKFGTISRLERGENSGSIWTVELLADALGLTIDEYVGHKVEEKKKESPDYNFLISRLKEDSEMDVVDAIEQLRQENSYLKRVQLKILETLGEKKVGKMVLETMRDEK